MRDNTDKILDVLATPDWVTPLLAIISWLRGRTVGIAIERNEYAWADVRLRSHGIKMKYAKFYGGECLFSVNKKQAKYARYLLGM